MATQAANKAWERGWLYPDYCMNSDIEYFFVYKVTYKLTTI